MSSHCAQYSSPGNCTRWEVNHETLPTSAIIGIIVASVILVFIAAICILRYPLSSSVVDERPRPNDEDLAEYQRQVRAQCRAQEQQSANNETASRPRNTTRYSNNNRAPQAQVQPSAPPAPIGTVINAAEIREEQIKSNLFSFALDENANAATIVSTISDITQKEETFRAAEKGTDEKNDNEGIQQKDGETSASRRERIAARFSFRNAIESWRTPKCVICLMAFEGGDTLAWAKREGCNHCYHQECIVQWLSTTKRDGETLHDGCPCCRHKIIRDGSGV